jgi:GAF domain-containing protein
MESKDEAGHGAADGRMLDRLEEVNAHSVPAPLDAAAMVLAGALELLGADAGFVGTVAPGARVLEVARVTPFSKSPVRLAFPVDSPYPLAVAIRDRQALFIASNEQLACDHPGLVRVVEEDHACATMPLFAADGGLLGAVNVGFEDPHEFDDDERTLIGVVAKRCAAALGRVPVLSD